VYQALVIDRGGIDLRDSDHVGGAQPIKRFMICVETNSVEATLDSHGARVPQFLSEQAAEIALVVDALLKIYACGRLPGNMGNLSISVLRALNHGDLSSDGQWRSRDGGTLSALSEVMA
jgi:hypothetical protein